MTITLTREEAQQVLSALETLNKGNTSVLCNVLREIKTFRARLAQPEPEPVLWLYDFPNPDSPETDIVRDWTAYSLDEVRRNQGVNVRPLYTVPPQREWVGLTDEEIAVTSVDCAVTTTSDIYFARAIEAKIKQRNHG